jgi:hypothetical protein
VWWWWLPCCCGSIIVADWTVALVRPQPQLRRLRHRRPNVFLESPSVSTPPSLPPQYSPWWSCHRSMSYMCAPACAWCCC